RNVDGEERPAQEGPGQGSWIAVTFVTADRTVWTGQAAQVVVPAADGSMGILPQMQPTLAVLERGLVRISDESGQATERSVVGGFVSVGTEVVTIACGEHLLGTHAIRYRCPNRVSIIV